MFAFFFQNIFFMKNFVKKKCFLSQFIADRYKQIVIVSIIVIAVLITAIVAKYFMWNKTKYTEEHKKLVELARVHQKHELEIKVSNIQLEGVTGEGSFGIVYKGFVKSMNCPVAVKMLKSKYLKLDMATFSSLFFDIAII